MNIQEFNQGLDRRPKGKFPVYWTNKRSITRRAVMWVGHTCDIKCVFCYDRYMDARKKKWLPFEGSDGAKERVEKFRYYYKNQYIDFMGGEPTLYPHIYDLIEHCARIGLEPTCITHGLRLSDLDRVKRFKDAGIHDFLVSIHGIGDINDKILHVRKPGATDKQIQALENLRCLGIPFRFNVTLIDLNKEQLPEIAKLAVDYGASVINWITFNPYFEWETNIEIKFQARYTEIVRYLKQAIDVCTANGIEANVRYMPLCQLKGYEQHIYNGHQLPYDLHEWDYNSWYDNNIDNPSVEWYRKASFEQQQRYDYVHDQVCDMCAMRNICDGFHKQYAVRYGFSEANPYNGELIDDPTFFIRNQLKIEYTRDED